MTIAVLGSGNGGCAVAFDWAKAGHAVRLVDFPQFPANVAAISQQRGIHAEGQLAGFAPIEYAGHDIERALNGADLLFLVGPAYSTQPFGEACRPHLKRGQTAVVCPGSCGGAVVLKNALGLDLQDTNILIAETHTLPYAVRVTEPGKIHVFLKLKAGVFLAALPHGGTDKVLAAVRQVYPCLAPAKNVLQTALQNANPVIHPAVMLLSAARIERTAGAFGFYEEGVTPAVGRLIEALDRERAAIGAKLGLKIIPDPVLGLQQGYVQEATYYPGYARAAGFQGIRAPESLDHRYFHEDVGYGLVFMTSLARQAGVATPVMDAVIDLVSTLMGRDYRKESPRTVTRLGLNTKSLDDLLRQL